MISERLQEVLEDEFGLNVMEEVADDFFNPNHPYFSIAYWDNGQVLCSHENIDSMRGLVVDAYNRSPNETYCYVFFDSEGNRLRPNFSSVVFEKVIR